MKLVCGYTEEGGGGSGDDIGFAGANATTATSGFPPSKKVKIEDSHDDELQRSSRLNSQGSSHSTPETQQATPAKTPSPLPSGSTSATNLASAAIGAGLLNAGNLNNLNLSHLVNNLSNLGDLGSLGSISNLSSLAALAQLPIDLTSLSALGGVGNLGNIGNQFSNAFAGVLAPGFNDVTGSLTKSLLQHHPQLQHSAQQLQHQQLQPQPQQLHPQPQHQQQQQQPLLLLQNEPTTDQPPNLGGPSAPPQQSTSLNMLDLRLMYHFTTQVSTTITGAGISDTDIWNHDVPMLAFEYPFLMHAILAFSATHLSRTEKGLDHCVTSHRGDALRLLREAILDINSDNTDALVASALILIMDSLANASAPSLTSPKSLPASAWIFHVKGAATILTAVWPLTETSRFYKFISVDLGDLGDIINEKSQLTSASLRSFADLDCHDNEISDLYPVPIDSPYLITLAYLSKLHKERYKADFILRIFAFPALLEKEFLGLLMSGDIKAMRIMRSYYSLLRSFTMEMKDKVWFLEGVSQVLPVDVEEYAGGAGGMHMMLDFLGGGPSIVEDHEVDKDLSMIDPGGQLTNKLIDTDNLPSDITSNLEIMQGDNGLMGIK